MFILLLLPFCQFTHETEIYIPLFAGNVVVSDDGKVFLLNQREGEVHAFEGDRLVRTFGRKGKGPGEFFRPAKMSVDGDGLFIHDMDKMHQFDLNGAFIRTVRLPEPFLLLERVTGKWVGNTGAMLSDGDIEFMAYDPGIRGGEPFFVAPDGLRQRGKHRLFHTTPKLMVDRKGEQVIVVEFEAFKVHVFDGATLRHTHTIEKDVRPMAMDRDWAKERIASRESGDDFPGKMPTLIPDYFPQIRKVALSPENHLLIFRWAPDPNRPERLVFDLAGRPAKSVIQSMAGAARVLGVVGDRAIVSTFNDGVGHLHYVAWDEVDAFAAKHPIVFDLDVLLPPLPEKPQ